VIQTVVQTYSLGSTKVRSTGKEARSERSRIGQVRQGDMEIGRATQATTANE